MKVLVVGNGGREHALAWKLLQSSAIEQVYCLPGNGGTQLLPGCHNISLSVDDFAGIAQIGKEKAVDLVVVGPELPLAQGIADYLQERGLTVFGPSQAGAQIEASKTWAKDLMQEAGVPTAASATFTDPESATAYVKQQGAPIVVKADGLAAGKGVTVAMSLPEAQQAIEELFGDGFAQIVIEDYLEGEEASVLALTDGLAVRPLLPAQDHKRIGEGDTGENTGGMGAYAPAPLVTTALMEHIEQEILQPIVKALRARNIDYRGVLYAGLMIARGEPKVLEFNCRFGDPETQALLPLLKTPLEELMLACTEQRLAELPPIQWREGTAVCVVAAASGYPRTYPKGMVISGIDHAEQQGAVVFHAGTEQQQQLKTSGGRVLGVTAVGKDFAAAIATVYAAMEQVQFEGIYYRRDIGHQPCP
ncbi:MAG: phosphoribosylamine--glycine ligase [Cyanophyceae cyanobacterium]